MPLSKKGLMPRCEKGKHYYNGLGVCLSCGDSKKDIPHVPDRIKKKKKTEKLDVHKRKDANIIMRE